MANPPGTRVDIVVCQQHGLRYNRVTDTGCAMCRREGVVAEPSRPAVATVAPSTPRPSAPPPSAPPPRPAAAPRPSAVPPAAARAATPSPALSYSQPAAAAALPTTDTGSRPMDV